jgi:tetratricopeptide (TPR) repeat protein
MEWLQGKQVAFTGKLACMTRREASDLIRTFGGHCVSSVNHRTAFLLVGQESWPLQKDGQLTHQLKNAQELQQSGHSIAIISEEEFLSKLNLQDRTEGVHRLYTLAQLTNLLNVPRNRVRAWMHAGLIEPVETMHGVCYFDFRQVVGAKTLCELARAGISIEKIRRSLEQLQVWLPDAEQPLDQLALLEKNGHIMVRLEEGLVEPSGQMFLDFGDSQAIVQVQSTSAEQWFEIGCQHEEEGFLAEAVDAYRHALLVGGPDAEVCFNLANVLCALGQHEEASERYRQVVEIDCHHAEAWNNLGVVLTDLKRMDDAIEALRRAIDLNYIDAHYNLADLLETTGKKSQAHEHWHAYLRHEPHGPWSKYARSKLA